jgi:hypothetical protein
VMILWNARNDGHRNKDALGINHPSRREPCGEWASAALVIQEKSARTRCQRLLVSLKEEQAASHPLADGTEKAVRKLKSTPESRIWMVWARNRTMLVPGGQGTWAMVQELCAGSIRKSSGGGHGLEE